MFPGFFGGGGGGGDVGGFFGGGRPGRFDHQYQAFPVSFIGKEDLEKGNKIILPASALDHLSRLNISYPMLFEMHNTTTVRRTHCGVQEFVAEEGTCYLPYWMMENLLLKEGDLVQVTNTSLPKGTYVKLQPVTSDFLDINNPRAVLENSLRNFATLTVGDIVVIEYNQKKYEIEIADCKPANAVSIIEADVNVDFAPPKDYKEPEPQARAAAGATFQTRSSNMEDKAAEAEEEPKDKGPQLFAGTGQRVDGKAIKASPAMRPSASPQVDDDEKENMPWKRKIPRGVKWVEAPFHYGDSHMTGRQDDKPKLLVPKEKLFEGSGKTLQ
jgi:ubiquitin fusion degradation protein 1